MFEIDDINVDLQRTATFMSQCNHKIILVLHSQQKCQPSPTAATCRISIPRWLQQKKITQIVQDKLHELEKEQYTLFAYCIMPNHVRLLIQSRLGRQLPKVGRSGAFWTHESYDHFIRDEREFANVITYILNNPVKAGLVAE